MNYILSVQVLQTLQGLAEKFEGLSLFEHCFGVLIGKQIALFCELHNHINKISIDYSVPEGDNVGMLELGVQSNLSFD